MTNNITKALVFLLFLLVFSGCATSINRMSPQKVHALNSLKLDNTTGLLFFHREPTSFVGSGAVVKLTIDQREVATLGNDNAYVAVALKAGQHSLEFINTIFNTNFKSMLIQIVPNIAGLMQFSMGDFTFNPKIENYNKQKLQGATLVDFVDLR